MAPEADLAAGLCKQCRFKQHAALLDVADLHLEEHEPAMQGQRQAKALSRNDPNGAASRP